MNEQETLNRLIYIQSAIRCGTHSGFPLCCIKFFIAEKLWMTDEQSQIYYCRMQERSQEIGGKWWGYIPCPDCLAKGNMVEVLPCPNGKMCHPGDGQPFLGKPYIITPELSSSIKIAHDGFNAIQTGTIPIGGSLATIVKNSLNKIKEALND